MSGGASVTSNADLRRKEGWRRLLCDRRGDATLDGVNVHYNNASSGGGNGMTLRTSP